VDWVASVEGGSDSSVSSAHVDDAWKWMAPASKKHDAAEASDLMMENPPVRPGSAIRRPDEP
jgi:hypothetical protein